MMTEDSEMPYSLQNGFSSEDNGKENLSHSKTDAPILLDSPVILNLQGHEDTEESKLDQEHLESCETNDCDGTDKERDLKDGKIGGADGQKEEKNASYDSNEVNSQNISEEDSVGKLDEPFGVNLFEENHQSAGVVDDIDIAKGSKVTCSDVHDLNVSCQKDFVDVLVSKEPDLSAPSFGTNTENEHCESSVDLSRDGVTSLDQNSLIVVNSGIDNTESDVNCNIDINLNKTISDSDSKPLAVVSENTPVVPDILNIGDHDSSNLEGLSKNILIVEDRESNVDASVSTSLRRLSENNKEINIDDSKSEGIEGQSSLNQTELCQLSSEQIISRENLELESQITCLGDVDTGGASLDILEEVEEYLVEPSTGYNNFESSLEKLGAVEDTSSEKGSTVEDTSQEEGGVVEDIDMGKKSGSFSKKNGGLYVYSKDEFRESYQTNPKPKSASRFTRSQPRAKESNTSKAPQRRFSAHDTTASSSAGIPSQISAANRPTSSPELEQSTSPSLEVHSGTSSSSERRTSHSVVTVELLASEKTSPSHAMPESINDSFVVTTNDQAEQGVPSSSQAEEDDISSAAEGTLQDVIKTDPNQAKSTPIPAPRLSISSSSSTPPTPKSVEPKSGVEHATQQGEQAVSSPCMSPQPDQESSKVAKSPDLSEIMCITRTVDGEEELILGAGPMFANQQKLTMESAIAQDVSRSLLAQDRASVSAPERNSQSGPRSYKNYACIEPVGVRVEGQGIDRKVQVENTKQSSQKKESAPSMGHSPPMRENGFKEEDEVFLNEDVTKPPAPNMAKSKVDSDDGGLDEDDDDDAGINDAAYHISDWMYLGSSKELCIVAGKEGEDLAESLADSLEEDNLKISSGLQSANSMDSLETTPSEKEFKNHYPSLSLRKIKREGSVLGYRKLTDITREREVVINFNEKVKSYGFRIQYSKPAIVTEVDAGGAAEEKGLRIGDVILGVNGTDVRKAPHATVVKLVQTGPPQLHLLVGTNMCNSPNQDLYKPIKTGYMHKLGGQGMLKNWKKRWFVLKHDGCLYYYKTKDEVDPLGAVVLTNYTLVKARDAGKQHAFKISKYKARTYYFYTETEEDMNSWAKAITEAAQKKTNADVWLDISTHNVGLPALSIKNPDCRGFLTKQGHIHKSWKKRYCVLKDACMYYYTDIKQPQALGIVHFHGYKIQETELAGKKYGFVLEPPIPQLRTYYFIADNETDRKRWVAALATSIGRWIQTNEEDAFSKAENKDEEMLI